MSNPAPRADDPMAGEFVLAAHAQRQRAGLPLGRAGPQAAGGMRRSIFWDQFSKLRRARPATRSRTIQSACSASRERIPPRQTASFQFLLGWRFPQPHTRLVRMVRAAGRRQNRHRQFLCGSLQERMGSRQLCSGDHLDDARSAHAHVRDALRESTLPAAVKEAASANLSTLATTTCFRTADGEFHGFEGSDDHAAAAALATAPMSGITKRPRRFSFPSFARSLRRSAFGYSMDDAGAIHFRQLLPDGKARSGFAAADGQMGQIIHAWLDWKISGDDALCCAAPGRAQRRRSSLPGFPADGMAIETA